MDRRFEFHSTYCVCVLMLYDRLSPVQGTLLNVEMTIKGGKEEREINI